MRTRDQCVTYESPVFECRVLRQLGTILIDYGQLVSVTAWRAVHNEDSWGISLNFLNIRGNFLIKVCKY
jgi:hypothetical protein